MVYHIFANLVKFWRVNINNTRDRKNEQLGFGDKRSTDTKWTKIHTNTSCFYHANFKSTLEANLCYLMIA